MIRQFILKYSAELNKPDNMENINDNNDGTKGFDTHKSGHVDMVWAILRALIELL